MQPAVAGRFKGTPLVANTVAFLYRQLGKTADADRMYDVANSAGMAQLATAAAKPAKAKKVIDLARSRPVMTSRSCPRWWQSHFRRST